MTRVVLTAIIILGLCGTPAGAQPAGNEQITAVLDQIKKKAGLKFDPTTVQSAIDAAAYELQKLSTITIAASVDQAGANAAIAQQLKSDGGKFTNPKFALDHQTVDGTIDYSGSLAIPVVGPVDLKVTLHAGLATSVQIVADRPTAEFKVGFAVRILEAKTLSISRNGKSLPGYVNEIADAVVNGVLVPAQALLSRAELRLPTTIAATIQIKPQQKRGLTVSFDPKSIATNYQIVGLAHIIDNGRIVVVVQESGTSKSVSTKPTNVDFNSFRNNFQTLLTTGGAMWINQGQFAAYIDRDLLRRLPSKMLSAGPVCMQAKMNDLPVPFDVKLKLPPLDSIDCTPARDCTPTKECSQTMDCSQAEDCSACIVRNPFGGCTIRGNDPICEARKVGRKANCEAEKSRRKGQCEVDKATNKATCEAAKTTEKTACEALKETYKHVRATGADYANVESKDLLLSGDAKVCINDIALDPKELRLTAKLVVQARAGANGHIRFTPLNVVGHFTCFAPFTKALSIGAEVPSQPVNVDTNARYEDDSTQATVQAIIANPIHIRFPFAIVASELAGDPKFTIVCPIPGAAMSLRASTPDSWWPSQARGNIERDLPDFAFDLDLLRKPLTAGQLHITGKLRRNDRGVGGVFNIQH
jgi:hypothetical protein